MLANLEIVIEMKNKEGRQLQKKQKPEFANKIPYVFGVFTK